MSRDYLIQNKKAYDDTATEFIQKISLRSDSTVQMTDWFAKALNARVNKQKISVLELGPGSGHASKLLSEKGFEVTAIEISEKMAQLAHETAPNIKMIVGEFLNHDFKGAKFDGIYAQAFIHLFPAEDAELVMLKIKSLLDKNGVCLISTTLHKDPKEGYLAKTNFKNKVLRYRKEYTEGSLEALIVDSGMVILDKIINDDQEVTGKLWMNVIIKGRDD